VSLGLPDLRARATGEELLDAGVPEPEALKSLADLRFVNRVLGNFGTLRRTVRELIAGTSRPLLLDVGCGSADVPARLAAELPGLRATGVDLKPLHLRGAAAGVRRVVADARALPFAAKSFDVVTASLFLHHFDAPEAVVVVRELLRLCRVAVVVNDLRRALVPYAFGSATFRLLFRSSVSVDDGLLSIRKGFTADELKGLIVRAGASRVTLRRSFPYRLLAVARP
jgi:SAM-dependent methyltransferase